MNEPPSTLSANAGNAPIIRVMALHALAYCERLFYLEEVEEIRVADHRVHAGRTLHDSEVDKEREWQSLELASQEWGIRGKVDFARYRDGRLVAVEHKKGRSKGADAWDSDKLQVTAYAVLLSEHFGRPVPEGRIRYHASNKTVRVAVDDPALQRLRQAVARARELSISLKRPPVTENENLCAKCSLAPVCLPEESRLAAAVEVGDEAASLPKPRRLFPRDDARRVVHVVDRDAQVRRSGLQLVVRSSKGEDRKFSGMDVGAIVLHGSAQITSQAIHFAVANEIAVHWISGGGWYVGGVAPPAGAQRRLRQYRAPTGRRFTAEPRTAIGEGEDRESVPFRYSPVPHPQSARPGGRVSEGHGERARAGGRLQGRGRPCAAPRATPLEATLGHSPNCWTRARSPWHSRDAAGARRSTASTRPSLSATACCTGRSWPRLSW